LKISRLEQQMTKTKKEYGDRESTDRLAEVFDGFAGNARRFTVMRRNV
jgi:hypothetical protein